MRLLTDKQEATNVQMVVEMNAIRQQEIQQQMVEKPAIFHDIIVSLSTIAPILNKHHLQMKHIYRVPFERNSQRVEDKRYEYVQVSHVLVLHY